VPRESRGQTHAPRLLVGEFAEQDPLRILFAAPPELLAPVLRIIHRVIAGFLLKQAGLKRATADTGAVTLIQRFSSAANLNIHLHCLVLDGVYRRTEGQPVFQEVRAPAAMNWRVCSTRASRAC